MSMENKIFKMSLDVSDLISNYKKAIKTMQEFNGPVRTIASFENQLNKLEKEFINLQKIGAEGIAKDPQSVQSYINAVNKAYKAMASLGDEISKVGKDTKAFDINAVKNLKKEIEAARKEAERLQKAFATELKDAGFDKKTAEAIASEVKSQDELIKKLKEEKNLRKEISKIAQKELGQTIKSATKKEAKNSANLINDTSTSAASLTTTASEQIKATIARQWENYNKELEAFAEGRRIAEPIKPAFKNIKDFLGHINKYLTDALKEVPKVEDSAKLFDETWKTIRQELQQMTGTSNKQSATGIKRLSQSEIFSSLDAAKLRAQAPFNAIEAISISSSSATKVKNADQSIKDIDVLINQVKSGTSSLNAALEQVVKSENNVKNKTNEMGAAIQQDAKNTEELSNKTTELTSNVYKNSNAFNQQAKEVLKTSVEVKKTESAISKFAHMIGSMFSIYTIFASIRSEIRKTYEDIKTLDKSFASIAMVTDKTVQDMWATYDQYANMAAELGQKTNSVIEASALFYQQGLDTNEALELTTNTMKLATLAGEDYKQATEEMTAAIRGFRMEMDEGAHVTDVYSTLAAGAAASVNDIASAISRTASLANSAGASFENTSAFLTKMIETTQESAENIGFSENS